MLALHGLIVCGTAAALAVLWSGLPLSGGGVRALEFAVFGLAAAYLSAHQYDLMVRLGAAVRARGPRRSRR